MLNNMSHVGTVSRNLALLLLVSFSLIAASGTPEKAMPFPSDAIFSITVSNLVQSEKAKIIDFAISPDGSRVTVGFETSEPDDQLRIALAEWEIKTKRLIAKTGIDKPIPPIAAVAFVSLFRDSMHYSPDGSKIIIQVGGDLYGFRSGSLAMVYSISPDVDKSADPFEQLFSISADGGTFAVLMGQSGHTANRAGTVYLYDSEKGLEKAHWIAPVRASSLSLSRDGKELLLTDFSQPRGILLLESYSGRLIGSFLSGFGRSSPGGVAAALFTGDNRFVAGPGPSTGSAPKVFDLASGKILAELTYRKFAHVDGMWVSSKDSTLAILNAWPLKRSFGEGGPKHAEILLFHAVDVHPFCVMGPLPEKSEKSPRQSGFIRFSSDLSMVGLFMNDRVNLYSMLGCT